MSKEIQNITNSEIEASERRAARLKEVNEELNSGKDSDMADILAKINANNNKKF